jgi:hypothetical protein
VDRQAADARAARAELRARGRAAYRELGADHVPTDQTERRAKKLVHQLKALGFDVQLAPTAVAPT